MEPGAQPGWLTATRIVLQVLIPIIMVLTSVRLLMTDAFVRFNYALPGFPEDRYGFTQADRLHHAPIALDCTTTRGSNFWEISDLRMESRYTTRGSCGTWKTSSRSHSPR